jgi:hypothetical protein
VDSYRQARSAGGLASFDSATYSVTHLQAPGPDVRYGVRFKDTNEYGLFSFYVFDDGSIHHSYSRTSSSFEEEEPSRPIQSVVEARSIIL